MFDDIRSELRPLEPEEYIRETIVREDEYISVEDEVSPMPVDHFEKHRGRVVKVNFSAGGSVVGTLIQVDDSWITVRKRDGYEVEIKKKGVDVIGEIEPRDSC
jgi:hypothetical protein